MDNINAVGKSIRNYNNTENHLACRKKCEEEKECHMWTYVDRMCYMKSENTFNQTVKGNGHEIVSGTKYCNSEGRYTKILRIIVLDSFLELN